MSIGSATNYFVILRGAGPVVPSELNICTAFLEIQPFCNSGGSIPLSFLGCILRICFQNVGMYHRSYRS
jgi:hypothetical protein